MLLQLLLRHKFCRKVLQLQKYKQLQTLLQSQSEQIEQLKEKTQRFQVLNELSKTWFPQSLRKKTRITLMANRNNLCSQQNEITKKVIQAKSQAELLNMNTKQKLQLSFLKDLVEFQAQLERLTKLNIDNSDIKKGLELSHRHFMGILAVQDAVPIVYDQKGKFDPELHERAWKESPVKQPQKGWKIRNRVVKKAIIPYEQNK